MFGHCFVLVPGRQPVIHTFGSKIASTPEAANGLQHQDATRTVPFLSPKP